MRVSAYGRSIDVPKGWEARIFRQAGGAPVLHLATFPLHDRDGDFGAAATERMRPDDIFVSLVEYRRDTKIRAGKGLFAVRGCPRSLRTAEFSPDQLQVTRHAQLGVQRFFTEGHRPCCLYCVLRPGRKWARQLLAELNPVLATLRFTTGSAPGGS